MRDPAVGRPMAAINIPRPPWVPGHACTTEGCGHVMAQHAKPIREDGHCTIAGCPCDGWDPLTEEQWRTLFAQQRRDMRTGPRMTARGARVRSATRRASALAAAIDVANELAWYPVANATGKSSWYRRRQDGHVELQRRLSAVRVPVNASPQLVALVVAMERVARASFSNRCGLPCYERRHAMLQLRGCLAELRQADAA